MTLHRVDHNRLYTARLHSAGIKPGDRLHLGIVGPGQVCDDAVLTGLFEDKNDPTIIVGIRVQIGEHEIPDLWWGDLIELWKLDARGNKVSEDLMSAP